VVTRDILPALVLTLLLVGLHILGAFSPGALTWGFHSLGFLPPPATAFYLLLAALATIWALRGNLSGLVVRASEGMARKPLWWLAGAIALFLTAAVLLRVKAPLLGDGFFLVRNFSEASHGMSPLLLRNEPLATLYYYGMMQLLGASTYEGFLRSFLAAQVLLGAGFIACAFYTARTLFKRPEDRLLGFLMALSLPSMQLFFGYVETYGALLFTMSLYLLASALFLRGRVPFPLVSLTFLLMAVTHFLGLLMVPSLLYLGWREWRARGVRGVVIGAGIPAAILFTILLAVNFELWRFTATVPHSHALPLERTVSTDEEFSSPYNLFSLAHGLDLLNFAVLTAAVPLVLLVTAFLRGRSGVLRLQEVRFLSLAVLPAAAFLLVAKFDLGPAKDWDVLASYALPAVLFALAAIFSVRKQGDTRSLSLLTGIMLLNTAAFISLNANEEGSLRRMISLIDRRSMSHLSYYSASLTLALYYHQVRDTEGPLRVWERYITAFPSDSMGYRNLLRNLENHGPARSPDIARTYERWMANVPGDSAARPSFARFWLEEGDRKAALGHKEDAAGCYERALAIDSLSLRAYNNLGSIMAERGNLRRAIELFWRWSELNPASSEPFMNLAGCYRASGEREKAIEMFRAAALRGNTAAAESLRQKGPVR
jgi:hypothetical protein